MPSSGRNPAGVAASDSPRRSSASLARWIPAQRGQHHLVEVEDPDWRSDRTGAEIPYSTSVPMSIRCVGTTIPGNAWGGRQRDDRAWVECDRDDDYLLQHARLIDGTGAAPERYRGDRRRRSIILGRGDRGRHRRPSC